MKKWMLAGLVSVVILCSASLSFSEETENTKNKETGMKKGMMMDGKKMGMMGPMMMKMMDRSIVATTDGGVVVLAGNKITKYDRDLNVVKEAEVKVDMDAMQKDMAAMMKMCPMMKDGMRGREDTAAEAGDGQAKSGSDPVDHEAHH